MTTRTIKDGAPHASPSSVRSINPTDRGVEPVPSDAARYLNDEAAIAECLSAVLGAGDADLLLLALGDVARAKGMAQVAKDVGLGRGSLYKALTPGSKPRFDTVLKVARALGVKLAAQPT
jgi:probable addiction module antidote protein